LYPFFLVFTERVEARVGMSGSSGEYMSCFFVWVL
jgi:hypothetical protein